MTSGLRELLERFVEQGVLPGAVAALGRGDDVELVAVGDAGVGGEPMRTDAIVRIQSMTKAITAVAALRLVEAGRIELDSDVTPWLPELRDRRVLVRPDASLDETEPAVRPITLRHLLTNESGYGIVIVESPLQEAMVANGTAAGPEPPELGADDWLARLTELPLAFQPGAGWRYHHSFGILGILISRITTRPLGDHLAEDLFEPLQMPDTAFDVPAQKWDRLPPAYRHDDGRLVETEPAGGGFYAGPAPFDVSHAELVSTVADFHRFARVLADGGRHDGAPFISAEHVALMTTDQVDDALKTPESFFAGAWDDVGWGFGVGIQRAQPHAGRFGWSGGQGTDFWVDRDGTIAILATQVEMGPAIFPLLEGFQRLQP